MKGYKVGIRFVVLVGVLLLGVKSAVALVADEVQSAHIKEADGTSGQDTNTGSGIKTGHIQNGAVTSAKIANRTIRNVDTNLTVMSSSPYTLIVATKGGDCNSIQTALNAIGAILPAATADQPYLVKVMPGTYTEQVTVKPYVHIQGSGIDVTIINTAIVSNAVRGANHARLSNLTVRNSWATSSFTTRAILNNYTSPVIDNIKAVATNNLGNAAGITNFFSSATITNSIVSVSTTGGIDSESFGIYNSNSSTTITNSSTTITNTQANGTAEEGGGYGLRAYDSSSHPKVKNSILEGSGTYSYSIYIPSGSSASFGNCQLIGPMQQLTGKRVNCYDGNFNPVPNL